MSKKETHDEDNAHVPVEKSTALLLLATYADTTWRMFVPAVGMTLVGVWLDGVYGTKPWLMAIGIVIGAGVAFLLVRKQFQRVRKG